MSPRIAEAIAATRAISLPDVLTVEDLAPRLRIGIAAIRSMLRNGRLPGRRVGRRWIMVKSDVLRALSAPPPLHLHADIGEEARP